jgi:hypothetical protein
MSSTKTRIAVMATVVPIAFSLASLAGAVSLTGKEEMLKRSGFQLKQADTPAKLAALKQLPPLHIFQKTVNGKALNFYADPVDCNCLLYGGAHALAAYRQEAFEKKLGEEEQSAAMTDRQNAMMNESEAANYLNENDWGAFGADPEF